jgi:glycosyltransferase involved in cell wall biosynthesis
MSQPILSILIPSIPERMRIAKRLMDELARQTHIRFDVEIILAQGKSFLNGGITVGKKREALVKRARGKYLCFLDDDDTVSPNYIETLLNLCRQDKDVCTFNAFYKLENYWGVVNMRLGHQVNEQTDPDRSVISRPPWHMCPVRSEFAKLYAFEDKNNAEDWPWMEKVLSHCKTEAYLNRIIFQYNHGKHSEVDKIEAHGK